MATSALQNFRHDVPQLKLKVCVRGEMAGGLARLVVLLDALDEPVPDLEAKLWGEHVQQLRAALAVPEGKKSRL